MVHITFKYLFRLMKCVAIFLMLTGILNIVTSLSYLMNSDSDASSKILYGSYFSNKRVKFILLWTDAKASPFNYFGRGSSIFKAKSCEHTNCYVTDDRQELGDSSLFDAILFNGPQLKDIMKRADFPSTRSLSQKYVYANIESAQNYPITSEKFNDFFNWTWTYRLDSDTNWGYFVVKNSTDHVIAPNLNVTWRSFDAMEDIDGKLKEKLKSKKTAAAWFASNCHTKSRREDFIRLTQKHLKKFSLHVDIFGRCGILQCPAFINERCMRLVEKDYYFYFAFENSFSPDYVTEKVLNAYRYNTVPVVYGGANYSRFLPPGSYIDANELGPIKLATTINHLITHPEEYEKYFRWQKYYSFHLRHESPKTDVYCKFCEVLNDDKKYGTISVHRKIAEWWNND